MRLAATLTLAASTGALAQANGKGIGQKGDTGQPAR